MKIDTSGQQVVRYRTETGVFTGLLAGRGRRYLRVILVDSAGLRVQRVPLREERYMQPLDYPVRKAKRLLRAAARRFNAAGLSRETRLLLRG